MTSWAHAVLAHYGLCIGNERANPIAVAVCMEDHQRCCLFLRACHVPWLHTSFTRVIPGGRWCGPAFVAGRMRSCPTCRPSHRRRARARGAPLFSSCVRCGPGSRHPRSLPIIWWGTPSSCRRTRVRLSLLFHPSVRVAVPFHCSLRRCRQRVSIAMRSLWRNLWLTSGCRQGRCLTCG